MTDFDDILAAIGRLSFQFAKTMPETPHEYVVKTDDNLAAYTQLFDAIKSRGRPEKWEGRRYRYLYPGDGWKYWIMTTVLSQSRIPQPRPRRGRPRGRARARPCRRPFASRVGRKKCKSLAAHQHLVQPQFRSLGARLRRDPCRPGEQKVVDLGQRPVADFFDRTRIGAAKTGFCLHLADHRRQRRPGLPEALGSQLCPAHRAKSGAHSVS